MNKISDSYYEIQREDLPPIFVFVSNYYALTDTLYSRTTVHINKDFHKRGNSYFFAKNPTFWIYGMRPLILRKSLYKQKN